MRAYTPILGRVCSFFTLVVLLIALTPGGAAAIEAPPPSVNPAATYLQTNGPTSPIGQGDWYTSNGNGAVVGYHYYEITVPCSWPATAPVYVDLRSPEMVVDSVSDEIRVANITNDASKNIVDADKTAFELYAPGTIITLPNLPAPTAAATTYDPLPTGNAEAWRRFATLPAPVACGTYVLRAETKGNDENAWRVRVGKDDDANPNNIPPTNYDNPDGVVGTDDEILIGARAGSYQNNAGMVAGAVVDSTAVDCLTLYEYVAPGQPSVAFQNFDMDISYFLLGRIRYYAPTDTYDPMGQAWGSPGVNSGSSTWNGVATVSRGSGDVITNPATGWWKIVTCAQGNNQYIQEGQTASTAYFTQPPIPAMTVAKDDGLTLVAPGDNVTYTITYTNTSSGSTAGSANQVVIKDTIPANTTYVSCSIPAADGTCNETGGIVTYTLAHHVTPGATGSVQVTVQVKAGVANGNTVVNNVTLDYKDSLGNAYLQQNASHTDTVQLIPVMTVTKTDGKTLTAPNENLTYTITYTNTASGPSAGPATNVVLQDTLPSNTSYVNSCAFVAPATGTCTYTFVGGIITVNLAGIVAPGASGQVTMMVKVNAGVAIGDSVVNNVTLTYKDTAGNAKTPVSASDTDIVQSPLMTVTKTDGTLLTAPNESLTYTITYTNTASGPSAGPAANVVLQDTLPTNTTYVSCSIPVADGSCTQANGVVTYTLSHTVIPGASGQVQTTVTVNAGVASGDSVVNTVTLNYKDTAGNAKTPVIASDTDTVQSPVMTVAKTDGKTLTATGDSLTYTITYTNTASGPSAGPAANVVLQDTLPTNTTYVSCAIPVADGSCSQANGVVTYTLSHTVAAGASGQVQTTVTVNTGTISTVVNTVTLNYKDSAGNAKTPVSASDTDQIVGPDLRLTKDASSTTIVAGQPITYTLTYLNNSAVTASGVVIAETVPVGTHFVAAGGTSGWSCPDNAAAGTACRLSLGTLVGNATGSVTFIVRVDKPFPTGLTQIDNTASISDDGTHGADPTPVNNVAATKKPPTAVTLTSFSADRQTKGVWLNWTTGSELNSLGFQIYRSTSGNRSDAMLVTPQFIVSRGTGASGASYSFLDQNTEAGASYHYWLIEQDIGGGSSEFGPVQITGLRSSPYQIFLPLILR